MEIYFLILQIDPESRGVQPKKKHPAERKKKVDDAGGGERENCWKVQMRGDGI